MWIVKVRYWSGEELSNLSLGVEQQHLLLSSARRQHPDISLTLVITWCVNLHGDCARNNNSRRATEIPSTGSLCGDEMIPHFAQQTEWTGTDLNKYLSASRDNTAVAFYFQNLHDSKINGEILKGSYFKIKNILTLIDDMIWFEDEFKML